MGFYSTTGTIAKTIFDIAKDVFVRFQLPLEELRGQCYDGVANVSGKDKKVGKIKKIATFYR